MCCGLPIADCPTHDADPLMFQPTLCPKTLAELVAEDAKTIARMRLRERFGSTRQRIQPTLFDYLGTLEKK